MKKLLLPIICLMLLVGVSCKNEASTPSEPNIRDQAPKQDTEQVISGPITISGVITNPTSEVIQLVQGRKKNSGAVKEGRFEINGMIGQPGYYELKYENRPLELYLRPGDAVDVAFDHKNLYSSATFTGSNAEIQAYLLAKEIRRQSTTKAGQSQRLFGMPEAEFKTIVDQTKKENLAALADFEKTHGQLDPTFIPTERGEIIFQWALDHHNYANYHPFYSSEKDYQPDAAFLSYQDGLELNNTAYLGSDNFKTYLQYDLGKKVAATMENVQPRPSGADYTNAIFDEIEAHYPTAEIKAFLLFVNLNQHLAGRGVNNTEPLLERFNQQVTNPIYRQEIQAAYNKWQGLRKGDPAPSFAYPDVNGQTVSLESLRGKYVYVDIWATWCGPCKTEIPALEKLQEKYHNQSVAFTSVSIDKNQGAWRKMLQEKNMKGLQLIADQAGNSQICKDYKVSGIPRFLLIDPEGKLVDAHAPRPSSGEVELYLDKVLGNEAG